MNEQEMLAQRFETERSHLRAVAYRMLGSSGEAEDAVQEAWLRLSRSDAAAVENLGGWLTTVVARVCLDMLRSRKARREDPVDESSPEPAAGREDQPNPEQDALLAESVGLALLAVLETLAPAERVAFVLHDMFDLSFDEIGSIVGRNAAATRQLASRARRRVQGASAAPDPDRSRRQEIVSAFIEASRGGNLEALLAVLDPDVVVRADRSAVQLGAAAEVRGAADAAQAFLGRAQTAKPAMVAGMPGFVVAPEGKLLIAFRIVTTNGRIASIDLIGDPDRLAEPDFVVFG
jgi:RNA polymerase sigma-70 factor (ECF subfamily)